jgi:two-component system sensor histidine kinase DesK
MGLREAITNVHRHAQATRVDVDLATGEANVTLTVRDNGRGGVVTRGNGLVGMAERLAGVGGSLAIDSPPGRGTVLRMTVPHHPSKSA